MRAALNAVANRTSAASLAIRQSVERALADARSQLAELTTLRLRGFIDDTEFVRNRAELQVEVVKLNQRLDQLAQPDEWIKPLADAVPLSIQAAEWFRAADRSTKRMIVRAVGSNLTLIDKKLSVEAARWLAFLAQLLARPTLLGE